MDKLIPVTIITGFLGAGKTTLLNRVLSEDHGEKIAIIENEFGEANIDSDLIVKNENEEIITMSNGCICCTIRGDLVENVLKLLERKDSGELDFDRVIIETTGVADPGPVAQTFFMDEQVAERFMVDGIITVVDALNGGRTLTEETCSQAQVGFADRILLTKVDLVDDKEVVHDLIHRLHHINSRAPIIEVNMGEVDIKEVLDIHGFNMDTILELDPDFLKETEEECECGCDHDHHDHDHDECCCGHHHDHDHEHEHEHGECCCGHDHHHHHHHHEHKSYDDEIATFLYTSEKPFDPARLDRYLQSLVAVKGPDLLRYKGVLYMTGTDRKMIFQGVHMLMAADLGAPWKDEKPISKIVFIGRKLPQEAIIQGLNTCLAE